MRELPILFNTPMVKAILDGRKSMTRRVIKPQPIKTSWFRRIDPVNGAVFEWPPSTAACVRKLPYQVGDKLWVRETWNGIRLGNGPEYWYRVDEPEDADTGVLRERWRPSIHMPKVAARIWLEVTNVRVERVQDISIRDIISEGSGEEDCRECFEQYGTPCCRDVDSECGLYEESFQDFTNLWDGINLKRGYVWDTNPWVWVIEFQQVAQ